MLTPGPHIHHTAGPYGTAVLDTRRGTWLMLDADASKIWHAVTVRGGIAGLADEIAIPTGQNPEKISERITAFVADLVRSGVLVDTARPTRRRRWAR